MDPNATLALILDGVAEMNAPDSARQQWGREQAVQAARDLADWLERGGFPPTEGYTVQQ